MRKAGRGSIVNISSLGALQGSKPYPSHAYAASKGGLIALTKVMAVTYGQDGIRVNVICPGLINTRLAVNAVPKAVTGDTPLRRAAEPDEIAHAILFLASDASSFVTGSNFVVDGGSHAVVTY
jgi:NAD(P)-dependent dehydrogenase (short-subunit alcohol dehydrogenase family)